MSLEWCESVVPTVMSKELLEECSLKDYCETPEAKKIVEQEGFEFSTVEILKLEFKNILKITNLEPFTSLTQLVLSNNCIEVIEGLDTLSNLVYLDLSFNNIVDIAGLDHLQSLEDLNLSHNRIKELSNLGCLKKLQLLALNDNQISCFSSFYCLFEVKSLKSACLTGNPFCQDPDYRLKCLAYMPNLAYLDYRLIFLDEKKKAIRTYHYITQTLEKQMIMEKKIEEEKKEQEKLEAYYKDAKLEGIHDYKFLDELINSHKSFYLLITFPAFEHTFTEFLTDFRDIMKEWLDMGTKHYELRKSEWKDYMSHKMFLLEGTLKRNRTNVYNFIEYKEKALLKLALHNPHNENEHTENRKFMETVLKKIDNLWETLMENEIDLVEYLELMYQTLCRDLPEKIKNFIDELEKVISKLFVLIDEFKVQMTAYYSEWCEKHYEDKMLIIKTAGSDVGGLSLEQIDVLKKDWRTVNQFIEEGCDLVKTMLTNRRTSVASELDTWVNDLVSETRDVGLERHRQRIIEIVHYCETAKKELDFVCKLVMLV